MLEKTAAAAMADDWREAYSEESGKFYYYKSGGVTSWTIPDSSWRKMKDKKSNKDYYVDVNTKATSWKLPDGVVVPQTPSRMSISVNPTPALPAVRASEMHGGGSGAVQPPLIPLQGVPEEAPKKKPTARPSLISLSHAEGVDQKSSKDFVDSSVPEAVEHKKKGNEFFHDKDYENALIHYTKAVDADPSCANLYFNRSATYYCLKIMDKALEDASKAVELAPVNPSALARLGFTQLKMKMLPEAYAAYSKAVELDPENKRCVQGLAKVKKSYTPE